MKRFLPLLIILPLLIWVGCEDKEEKLDSVYLAKEKWESKNITSYTINLSVNCFCPLSPPIDIKVENDIITEINGDSITQSQLENDYWYANTVNELFLFIEQHLAQDPHEKILGFNSTYGYPEEIWFDLEEMIADEEIGFIISSFIIN